MTKSEIDSWLAEGLPRFENLTSAVCSILESLLHTHGIDYLSVSGRTKTLDSIHEKIKRKGYADPKRQLTDISAVRVITYFESQRDLAAKAIESAFNIDHEHSLNKDAVLSADQMGYRSIHYVADLGSARTSLPEYQHLTNLRFEIQLRTVLQHAWAELAHDRNYKFAGKLPRPMERDLFLYAGLLEIADKGFDALSKAIDGYARDAKAKAAVGNYTLELDSVSLEQFVEMWSKHNEIHLEQVSGTYSTRELVEELRDYGLNTLEDLQQIIPESYAKVAKEKHYRTTIFGLLRDWMMLHDYERYRDRAWKARWSGFADPYPGSEFEVYEKVVGTKIAKNIMQAFTRPGE